MKKEKILSFTLYVFCILALFYAAVMLFQTNTQIATYNMSSYVPMTLGEKIQFLFSNTYVPFFFAIITYALGNIVDMLHAIKNPEETKTKSAEKEQDKEAAEEVTDQTQDNVDTQEETEESNPTVLEESDQKTADQTEESAETEPAEDTALESEPEKPEEDKAEDTDTAKDVAEEEAKPADDSVTEEAETVTGEE
jgi:hypothetical protein